MFFLFSQPDLSSLKALSKPTMTTVRPKIRKKVESFYIFLLLCLGHTGFASQFSETNFTKLPNFTKLSNCPTLHILRHSSTLYYNNNMNLIFKFPIIPTKPTQYITYFWNKLKQMYTSENVAKIVNPNVLVVTYYEEELLYAASQKI